MKSMFIYTTTTTVIGVFNYLELSNVRGSIELKKLIFILETSLGTKPTKWAGLVLFCVWWLA